MVATLMLAGLVAVSGMSHMATRPANLPILAARHGQPQCIARSKLIARNLEQPVEQESAQPQELVASVACIRPPSTALANAAFPAGVAAAGLAFAFAKAGAQLSSLGYLYSAAAMSFPLICSTTCVGPRALYLAARAR